MSCGQTSEHEHEHEHHHHEHEHHHEADEHDHGDEDEHDHEHEHSHEAEEHEHEHEHENANVIKLSESKAHKFGVKSKKIELCGFSEIIKVSGQILNAQDDECVVVAKSAGVVKLNRNSNIGKTVGAGFAIATVSGKNIAGGDQNEQAKIVLESAKRELQRLKPLYEEKIVTAQTYNAALENYERAKAACVSQKSNTAATTLIGGTITNLYVKDGEYVEAGTQIAKVSKNKRLVLRADLPIAYSSKSSLITSANVKPANSNETISLNSLNGKKISGSAYSSQPGYTPLFFEFDNNGQFINDTYAEVYLIGATKSNTIILPKAAITEELGNYFVYIQLDEDCYEKRMVTLGDEDGVNVEIKSGINNGEDVVVAGVTIVKLAGATGSVPSHSHSH